MLLKLTTFIFMISFLICYAQSDSLELEAEQIVTDLLEEPEEESDNSDLYEMIEYYVEHPVNLNTASISELTALPHVELSVARIIVDHRNKYGNYFSSNELYAISAIPDDIVKNILPFITVSHNIQKDDEPEQESLSNISFKMRNRILNDLQRRKGFIDSKFEGSPYKIYNRVQAGFSNILRLGFLTEKDAGERSLTDFSTGYLNVSNWLNFNNIIIGDYIITFGQGLALWGSYGFSKGSDAVHSVKKQAKSIKPYTSTTESNFFRGAALEYNWEQAYLTFYYSKNHFDANIDSVSGFITSKPLDGLHRTINEMKKRKSAIETTYGINLKYNFSDMFSLGILYYKSIFNHPFLPSKRFDIMGNNFQYYSSYYDLFILNYNIFGETAFDGKSVITFNGIKFSPVPEFIYTLSIRNYPKNYSNLHGFGFGERSGACQNEFGIYNGFRWRMPVGLINFYFDQFKFPYATYNIPVPSEGNELMLRLSTKLFKGAETHLRYKYENKEILEEVNSYNELVRRLKQSFRFEFIYSINSSIRVKTRLEYSKFFIRNTGALEEGYLIFEDLRIKLLQNLVIYGRAIFFQTDSFNSAIYEYENDLTGILSNVGLYGEGARFYFLLKYNFGKIISLSLKYSETFKPKESFLGSGYSQINGSLDNRIGLQLDTNL